ncbi:hypothetical protein FKW77_004041 [Venturia effusa]|uniref:Uncharacterized protein n=1 Tax=Venturia effusa TaxID=50376 RepID=A0A517LMM7_9PEZI|nr:hypothetical protein FKW77_004041 [Venturia effusa]
MATKGPIPQAHNSSSLDKLLTTSPDLLGSKIEERHRVLQIALSKSRMLLSAIVAYKATSACEISDDFRNTLTENLVPILAIKNVTPDGHSSLGPILSELHEIHSEAGRSTTPPLPPSKLPTLCALSRTLRHGHGIMGLRYAYHCLLAKPGAQVETIMRRQRNKAADEDGACEARVLYALNILQSRLEMLVAELVNSGVILLEEEGDIDVGIGEEESDNTSLFIARVDNTISSG